MTANSRRYERTRAIPSIFGKRDVACAGILHLILLQKTACSESCHFELQHLSPAQKGDATDLDDEQKAEIRLHDRRIFKGLPDSLIAYVERVCYTLKQ